MANVYRKSYPISAAAFLTCWFSLLMLGGVMTHAESQIDIYPFADEVEERRYKGLIEEFRCPKCLNTNLAGSDAPIAKDLRRTVYRLQVDEGYSDQQIRDYLRERYGDFVLYDPPFSAQTWYIWLTPIGLGILALAILGRLLGRARKQAPVQLSDADRGRLATLLEEK
jgi:cytochrome c-type biogenesis protein CcmH|tara:strand:+ start:2566 stop:3069 length:504 start_codon:yes stop_codon:yes gene_type:complete